MSKIIDIQGKRVLLVGSTGILGRVFARTLVYEGAKLVIADIGSSDLIEYATELGVLGIEIDIAEESSVIEGVNQTVKYLGGIDSLIINSAATASGLQEHGEVFTDFEEYPTDVWKRTLDINLTGPFLLAREVGRWMKQNGNKGSIITVSSIYGVLGPDHRIYEGHHSKSFSGYSATKAGVIGLTRWLATWWAKDRIRINCLVPGGVFNNQNEQFLNAYNNRVPMGRMAERDEMTGMLIYLISDASSYCTGQTYIVDGGFSAW